MTYRCIGVNPGGLGVVTPQILKWVVVEGVVSGLLCSKGKGQEPRTPQFSNQIDATVQVCARSLTGKKLHCSS
jgi:hypothetical protein